MYGKSYKTETIHITMAAALSDAFSEIEMLAEEMRNWADNMSSANMEHLPNYDTVEATASALEGVNAVEVPILKVRNGTEVADFVLDISQGYKRGKARGSESRAARCGNAEAMLDAVSNAVNTLIDELEDEDATVNEGKIDTLREFCDEVDTAKDEIGGLEFPGMRG